MRTLRLIASELLGLFVDDARLAVSVAALILALAAFSYLLPNYPLAMVLILTAGCVIILADATLRGARK